ncbi:MAG: major capsid protein [Cetobacterium sp.]|uniref:major capsid protein n=1 Tax=Cetobacterium sp. TaxID=2071632 RepID=UPI002FC5988D
MYELIALIEALKQIKRPNMFLWNLFIREEVEETTSKFEIQTKVSRRRMAPFVGKYAGGKLLEKDVTQISEFEPGIIKVYREAHANALLEQQFGQTIYGESIDQEELAEEQVSKELGELDEAITRTENWMLGKLLTTGIIPVVGDTVDRAIKYGEHDREVLSGTSLWSSPESDPVEYLIAKQLSILEKTGIMIDSICLSATVAAAFKNHPKVKERLKYIDADVIRIQPRNLGDGAKFLGTIPEADLDIYVFTDWVESFETKEVEAIIPEGEIIGGRSKTFRVHYGAIAQLVDKKRQTFLGKRVPKTWGEDKQDLECVQLSSASLIVPEDASGFFAAKVLA